MANVSCSTLFILLVCIGATAYGTHDLDIDNDDGSIDVFLREILSNVRPRRHVSRHMSINAPRLIARRYRRKTYDTEEEKLERYTQQLLQIFKDAKQKRNWEEDDGGFRATDGPVAETRATTLPPDTAEPTTQLETTTAKLTLPNIPTWSKPKFWNWGKR